MDPKVMAEIEKMVETMFSKKEDADKREAVTKALEDAKTKLSAASEELEAKVAEVAELEAKLGEVEAELASYKEDNQEVADLKDTIKANEEKINSLESEVAELKEAKEQADKTLEEKDIEIAATKEELEKVASELAEIKTAQLVASRMEDLDKEGVAREGEGREAQEAKIKDMSDDEFASYKAELVDIKKAVAAKLGSKSGNNTDSAGLNIETSTSDEGSSVEEFGKAFCEVFGIPTKAQ